MSKRPGFALSLLLSLVLGLVFCQPSWAEGRAALVIGNGSYPAAPLKNPVNDASDMAAALTRLGFEVTLLKDATMQQMETAVREFGLKLRKGGMGVFFYAGHGMQVAGENYLVPVNAVIQTEGDVKYGCLNAGLVLAKMEDAGNGPNVVILDACRNNPFARSFRSAEAGLARMDAPTGSIIAYATGPGKVASDGEGRNGLYTQHLLRNIATPGLAVTDLFMNVREGVVRDSGKKQVPWENTSLIGRFSFAGQAVASVTAPAPAVQAPIVGPTPKAVLPVVPSVQPKNAPAPTAEEAKLLMALREDWWDRNDEERVRKLATPLAVKGSVYGKYALGWLSGDDTTRHQATALAAQQGVALAMVGHAYFLAYQLGGPEDQAEARAWLRHAQGLGEPWAKLWLGDMLMKGLGGPMDAVAGERLFAEVLREEVALSGKVGSRYFSYSGSVLPAQTAEAKGLAAWKRGAESGLTHNMVLLGNYHKFDVEDRKQDLREAHSWLLRAAEKGDPEGMVYLGGLLMSKDNPGGRNPAAATRWYRKASDAGYEPGTTLLATCHLLGEGVPKDANLGLSMLRKLADKGSGLAQTSLAEVYWYGRGVPEDLSEAYFWFVVADENGYFMGRYGRESLAKKLPAAERMKIEARAAKWKPKAAKQ